MDERIVRCSHWVNVREDVWYEQKCLYRDIGDATLALIQRMADPRITEAEGD